MRRGIRMQAYRINTGTSLVIMAWNNSRKHFSKGQQFLFFRKHSKKFRSQSVAQPVERAKGASAPFSQIIYKIESQITSV